MAAVIGVRLLETVKEVTDFTELKTYYWSDSMVVLTWIKTKGLWNTFVGNRVKEIKKYSVVDQWPHVPGDMNIADVLSRGCSGKQLLEKQWWKGPQWLKEPENMWPKGEIMLVEPGVRKEYLAELVNYGQRREDFVKVGDVVMVGSDNAKRINWPMGKIIELYSGQDGIQRVAKVKTKNGVLVRPCLRLYRVKLPINDIQENLREDKEESTEQDKSEKVKKSRYGRTLKTPHRFTAT
ncbi:uncharacterized protein LOC126886111 [Diabrotica virgifera virgifera]|uniref:DUF5641 domain-containing protein n=1 Tax=Diabrotica virgifera virgifera TaxID=50390 RepID=A0ABM5KFD3_DIAVI|nr:uncharacterized protein LOC126886111 [Diabrotica virgifera virgifera]